MWRRTPLVTGWLPTALLVATFAIASTSARAGGAGASTPNIVAVSNTNPSLAGENLVSVSCVAANISCVAVGSYVSAKRLRVGVVLSESGGSWKATRTLPLPSSSFGAAMPNYLPQLDGVSCTGTTTCVAVASYPVTRTTGGATYPGLILTERARTWSTAIAPYPAGTTTGSVTLNAVSCASPADCTIVGSYSGRSTTSSPLARSQRSVILSDADGSWTASWATDPAGNSISASTRAGSHLDALSCPAAGDCTAVGTYLSSPGSNDGFILGESGGNWTATKAPLPAGGDGVVSLSGVSCASAGSCTAVGSYDRGGTPIGFVLTESSGTWRASVPPQPEVFNGLYATSCPVSTDCFVVGVYLDATYDQRGLLLSRASGHWATYSTPLPKGEPTDPGPGLGTTLSSVSCTTRRCTIVGTFVKSATNQRGLILNAAPFPS